MVSKEHKELICKYFCEGYIENLSLIEGFLLCSEKYSQMGIEFEEFNIVLDWFLDTYFGIKNLNFIIMIRDYKIKNGLQEKDI